MSITIFIETIIKHTCILATKIILEVCIILNWLLRVRMIKRTLLSQIVRVAFHMHARCSFVISFQYSARGLLGESWSYFCRFNLLGNYIFVHLLCFYHGFHDELVLAHRKGRLLPIRMLKCFKGYCLNLARDIKRTVNLDRGPPPKQ